jgi:beta-glucosidase
MAVSAAEIAEQATKNDVAIITIGRISGEFYDRKSSDFWLSEVEEQLISEVAEAFHARGKRVIVVLNVGGVVDVCRWRDHVDVVLCAWQAGQEGGNSVADVLTGAANPSGKLSVTWPIKFTDHWSSLNFPVDQQSELKANGAGMVRDDRKDIDYTEYDEGIYVGYRYSIRSIRLWLIPSAMACPIRTLVTGRRVWSLMAMRFRLHSR